MNQLIPIDNKVRARYNVLRFLFLIVIIGLVIYWKFRTDEIIYVFGSALIIWILLSINYLRKQNIKQASILEDTITLIHKRGKIEIPFSQIIGIKSALNFYIDFKGRLSYSFIIYLDRKYIFGSKLFIEYKAKADLKDEEPDEIKFIRRKLVLDD